jgi:Tfp pilus assembly protein PilZ
MVFVRSSIYIKTNDEYKIGENTFRNYETNFRLGL